MPIDPSTAEPRTSSGDFGVYVHVPFCTARCGYCDFATWTDRDHLVDDYVAACATDVERRVARGEVKPASSVFFGGGTPSLLSGSQLARILDVIPRVGDAEVTVECNPDAVDLERLSAYRASGVTRLSFGVQSLTPKVLAFLDRTHDPANVERAVGWARDAGFETFNLDLIYGTPGESVDEWRATLEGVLELDPPHVSAYGLTVEAGTPLDRRVRAGAAPAPDDDDQAAKYAVADEVLAGSGLRWYEVSNWARPGHECRHNLLYWAGDDYLAVGSAAHGHDDGRRWWNVRTPERYIERIAAGEDPVAGDEHLDASVRAEERFLLALRTRTGAHVPPGAEAEAARLVAEGLLERSGDQIVLSTTGRPLGGDLTARLLARAHWDAAAIGTR